MKNYAPHGTYNRWTCERCKKKVPSLKLNGKLHVCIVCDYELDNIKEEEMSDEYQECKYRKAEYTPKCGGAV